MNRSALAVLILGLAIALAGAIAPGVAAQDSEPVEVIIEWPNEGETLYAGPSSLEYSVPLKGRIAGLSSEQAGLTVELTVLQDGQVVGKYSQLVQDNAFAFLASVNPHTSEELFPAEHQSCADDCHRPGMFELPAGSVTVRVSIVEPAGFEHTAAERNFLVDRSMMATIPVELRLDGDPEKTVSGVTVSGATWLYLWRSRQYLAASDATGVASIRVEALSNAPTEYLLRVVPTVVDGVLYEGVEEARVELAPGATKGPTVTLHLRSRLGRIDGQVRGFDATALCRARAISLPEGNSFATEVSNNGAFSFVDLPIDQYRIVLEREDEAAAQLQQSIWEDVNLTATFEDSVSLPLAQVSGPVFYGQLRDEAGGTLPFGWVSIGDTTAAVIAAEGRYAITSDRDEASLLVQVPGFYSEARAVDGQQPETDFVVKPLEETQQLAWGNGALWLPAENRGELDGKTIHLVRGWLWGAGESDTPFHIVTESARVTVASARFALEYLPGDRGWLYVFAGEAELQDLQTGTLLTVTAGEMVNLFNHEGLQAVPYDPVVLSTLNGPGAAPIVPRWEPTLSALFRNRAGVFGIGAAQLITFVTYFLVLLSLGVTPLILLYLHYRRTRVKAAGDVETQR